MRIYVPWELSVSSSKTLKSPMADVDPYKPLPVIPKALGVSRLVLDSASPYTPTYVQSHLRVSDPAGLYNARIKGRHVPLANPVKDRPAKSASKKSSGKTSVTKALIRDRTRKGGWRLEKEVERFDLFVPLHRLWMGYMSELLGLSLPSSPEHASRIPNSASMYPKLVKADLHGSLLSVRQSRNPCLVGLSGIVLYESENAFRVITKTNQVKRTSCLTLLKSTFYPTHSYLVIPKQNTIFVLAIPAYSTLDTTPNPSTSKPADVHPPQPRVQVATQTSAPTPQLPLPSPILTPHDTSVPTNQQPHRDAPLASATVVDIPHFEFELYGNQFRYRSAERAGRKFKAKDTIEL
ncbi:RNase P subunit p29-like protein [Pisolithus albus]|nr:RNase P subunit p29-like protein [Pisolithus albus]